MEPKKTLPVIVEWYLLIRPEKISLLRFILEGYDGLAILTTISAHDGLVRMRTFAAQYKETMQLLNALAPELSPFSRSKSGLGVTLRSLETER